MRFLTWCLVLAECLVFFTQAQDRHDACPGRTYARFSDEQVPRSMVCYPGHGDIYYGKCINYNYTQVQEPGSYVMLVTKYISRHGMLLAKIQVVFMMDYDTYAGVLEYPPNSSGYTATIFSRTRMLDQMHVDKIRQKLSQCGFDLSNLKIIKHSDCPERSFSVTVPYNDTSYITI